MFLIFGSLLLGAPVVALYEILSFPVKILESIIPGTEEALLDALALIIAPIIALF